MSFRKTIALIIWTFAGKILSLLFNMPPRFRGFHGGSASEAATCNVGDLGLTPVLGKSPGGEHGKPLYSSCLENPDGQRSLVGYSGVIELDATEETAHMHGHHQVIGIGL